MSLYPNSTCHFMQLVRGFRCHAATSRQQVRKGLQRGHEMVELRLKRLSEGNEKTIGTCSVAKTPVYPQVPAHAPIWLNLCMPLLGLPAGCGTPLRNRAIGTIKIAVRGGCRYGGNIVDPGSNAVVKVVSPQQ
jgi:hypothetical protein